MNFDEAIKAHSEWKLKLQDYLRKPDRSLDTKVVALDNRCPLGQWIYGDGAKYKTHAEYETLRREHAHFHQAAAGVIVRADKGEKVAEETAIGSQSEFGKASSAVVRAIMEMKRKA